MNRYDMFYYTQTMLPWLIFALIICGGIFVLLFKVREQDEVKSSYTRGQRDEKEADRLRQKAILELRRELRDQVETEIRQERAKPKPIPERPEDVKPSSLAEKALPSLPLPRFTTALANKPAIQASVSLPKADDQTLIKSSSKEVDLRDTQIQSIHIDSIETGNEAIASEFPVEEGEGHIPDE